MIHNYKINPHLIMPV